MTPQFKVGDNIDVTDHHTCLGVPIPWPYYVVGIENDYYIIRRRQFKQWDERLPFSYKHVKLSS